MNNKKSIGKLRTHKGENPKAPKLIGKLTLQRTTMTELVWRFREGNLEALECDIAGWFNIDATGKYITVELSPVFKPAPPPSSLEEFLDDRPKDDEE